MLALSKIAFSGVPKSLPGVFDSLRKRSLWAVLIPCLIFLNLSPSLAETGPSIIPAEFGEVIYRCNPRSPNQLFIIGMAHRDSLTGLSGPNTARVQAEVYKLGEWLIQNERCELLFPEGFFASPAARTAIEQKIATDEKLSCPESIDIKSLEEKLSDKRSFVNAELLLKRNYPLKLRQVEDPKIHRAVGDLIGKLANCANDNSEYLRVKSDLDYLQERRTASMMQKIPEIIRDEFREGTIKSPKAIFTIGLSHLPKIIRNLEENRVKIYSPGLAVDKKEIFIGDLNLKKENFGVSIILPHTLAGDRKTLQQTGMDEIIARQHRLSSLESSRHPGN
jgi:hypothetical protein